MYFLAEGQEIKGRQSSLGNISQMQEIITPGGRWTLLREIQEFSIKLREAPTECGRVDSSALTCIVYTVDRILKNPKISDFLSVSTILHTVNNSWVKNAV